jgi:hypothetical protein
VFTHNPTPRGAPHATPPPVRTCDQTVLRVGARRAGGVAAGACGWAWPALDLRAPLPLPHHAHIRTFHAHARFTSNARLSQAALTPRTAAGRAQR